MKYLITLTPLEPFLFGGESTFGKKGDKEKGTYLVKSRQFPQQSAVLGMLKKEIMTQSGVLTRKVRGEWVDKDKKEKAKILVGVKKFDITAKEPQDFGAIKSLGSVFLMRGDEVFIKKVNVDSYSYKNGLLKKNNPKDENDQYFTSKDNIYDQFISIDSCRRLKSSAIFKPIEQTGNKTGGEENSLFKKTSYLLKHNFKFAFYLECDYELKDSIISLGADGSKFKLEIKQSNDSLKYQDKNNYLTLLSDAYITLPINDEHCEFAITSEISFGYLQNEFRENKRVFKKSKNIWLYEKGSIFIKPEPSLIDNLNNENLRNIGLNHFAYAQGENQ